MVSHHKKKVNNRKVVTGWNFLAAMQRKVSHFKDGPTHSKEEVTKNLEGLQSSDGRAGSLVACNLLNDGKSLSDEMEAQNSGKKVEVERVLKEVPIISIRQSLLSLFPRIPLLKGDFQPAKAANEEAVHQ
ncbi:hypothetical protein AMTR_s00078p00172470 [Amborella trichopoda]|uniref:Uncharacterized protein n=1 Tax=Amborella trichopoda TaxID=13333 RepID=W1P7I6_AMBTC|nr:hypothetical protein AMTR_s00078p00172470 [Amborella trichopoda]